MTKIDKLISFLCLVFLLGSSLFALPIKAQYGQTNCYGNNAGAFPIENGSGSYRISQDLAAGNSVIVRNPIGALVSVAFSFTRDISASENVSINYSTACPSDLPANTDCANCLLDLRFSYSPQSIKQFAKIKINVKLVDSVANKYSQLRSYYYNSPGTEVAFNKVGVLGNGLTEYTTAEFPASTYWAICGSSILIRTGAFVQDNLLPIGVFLTGAGLILLPIFFQIRRAKLER